MAGEDERSPFDLSEEGKVLIWKKCSFDFQTRLSK